MEHLNVGRRRLGTEHLGRDGQGRMAASMDRQKPGRTMIAQCLLLRTTPSTALSSPPRPQMGSGDLSSWSGCSGTGGHEHMELMVSLAFSPVLKASHPWYCIAGGGGGVQAMTGAKLNGRRLLDDR
jgi:hypothetical protein